MRIRNSICYFVMLNLFVAMPVLAAESISQIQSLQGQVWVQRGNEKIEANSASEIYSGDLISTSDTGRLDILLWSQLNLKLDASSKAMIVSGANSGVDTSAAQKMIKLEYGTGCVEINHLMDSTVFFQIGDRVTIKFTKPVELCLSTDLVKSHIQLVKGSAKVMHLTNSMVIALNEPGSAINFFNGGIFSLLSPSSASPQVIAQEDPKEFAKSEVLQESSKTAGLKALFKVEGPKELSKPQDMKQSPKTVDLKVPSKIEAPVVLSKTEGAEKPTKAEDLKESPKAVDLKAPSKTVVPIALSKIESPKESVKTGDLKPSPKSVGLKAPSKTEVPIALSNIAAPIALSNIAESSQPSKAASPSESSKTNNLNELYTVNLNSSRSYEATAAVNRRLRDSGYSSVVIDEIDNEGPLFWVSVPNFETVAAATGFVDKVVVKLGIHDAWIERHLTERAKSDQRKASPKKEELKASPKMTVDLKVPSKAAAPIALSKTEVSSEPSKAEQPNESIKPKNSKEFYNVLLSPTRSYEASAAVNRRLRDSGYSSVVIDEIDNEGPLFRVSIPNFETVTAARGFVDKVVVKLGIHDATIERHLKESSKTAQQKPSSKKEELKGLAKTQAPIALSTIEDSNEAPKLEDTNESTNIVDQKAPSKVEVPIALSTTQDSNAPSTVEESGESSNTLNSHELFNVYLKRSRSYEASAAVNRRLRDSGYSSVVIDEIDNQGPVFRVSVPNFETITAAKGFVDKVVVSLGIHDAWIERQRSKK